MSWISESKQRIFQDIRNLLLAYASHNEAVSSTWLIEQVENKGYFRDDVAFMYWSLVGDGFLHRVPKGVVKDKSVINYAFTTWGTSNLP